MIGLPEVLGGEPGGLINVPVETGATGSPEAHPRRGPFVPRQPTHRGFHAG